MQRFLHYCSKTADLILCEFEAYRCYKLWLKAFRRASVYCFDALSPYLLKQEGSIFGKIYNRIVQKIKNARWALGVSFKFSTRSDAISKKLHIIDFIRHGLMHQISYLTTTLWGNKTKERNYSKHPGLRTIFFWSLAEKMVSHIYQGILSAAKSVLNNY